MLTFSEYTNIGSRPQNEDNHGVAYHEKSYCFVVADGLGGHGGGEVASKIAVDTVCDLFVEKGWSENFFEQAFSTVQKSILEEQERQHTPSRMKTTLVILVIHENTAYYAHVGDSRLYYFKNHKVRKRTLDHSVPQMLALSGEIKESEIRHHPDRNRLIRVLGVKGESPRYEVGDPIKISGNQSFLLCTDGYWELIEEKQMENDLVRACDVSDWIEKMNQEIDDNGRGMDMDNYTCVAVLSHMKRMFHW